MRAWIERQMFCGPPHRCVINIHTSAITREDFNTLADRIAGALKEWNNEQENAFRAANPEGDGHGLDPNTGITHGDAGEVIK